MSEKKEVDSFCGAVIRSAKELKECENLEFLLGSWDAIRSGGGFEEDLHYEAGVILCSPLLLSLREASPGEKQRVLERILSTEAPSVILPFPPVPEGGSFLRDEKSGSPGKDVGKEEFDLRPPQTDLTLLILGDLKSPWKKEDSQRKQSPLFSSPAVHHLLELLSSNIRSSSQILHLTWNLLTNLKKSLEPLDQDKIKHLSSIALGSLQTACSTASKYDENHSLSENQTLLESLEIFSSVLELFKSSTRIGGCVPQNFLCFGVKIIFSNLILESFTPLSACLCSKALEWFDIMIEDLTGFDGFQMDKSKPELTLFDTVGVSGRLNYILHDVDLIPYLMEIIKVSYSKTTQLRKKLEENKPKKESYELKNIINSTDNVIGLTFCDEEEEGEEENEIKNSQQLEKESEDDLVLGKWMSEILFPSADKYPKNIKDAESLSSNKSETCGIESNVFLKLATQILGFFNKHFVINESSSSLSFIEEGFNKSITSTISFCLPDLDRTLACDTLDSSLSQSYFEFSDSLVCFLHNLLAYKFLSNETQESLLTLLNVNPKETTSENWPTTVFSLTLSLLAQTLLLRQSEKQSTNMYIVMWEKLLVSLSKKITGAYESSDPEEYINVEQMQLFLFFFHALTLMQKKQVLLHVSNTLIRTVSEVKDKTLKTSQIIGVSRIVLLFEYMMKHLYEPPEVLLSQVQHNLHFNNKSRDSSSVSSALISSVANTTTIVINETKDIPESQNTIPRGNDTSSNVIFCPFKKQQFADLKLDKKRPQFFNIFPEASYNSTSNTDVPKLDGLAFSFVLGTNDTLKYNHLYRSLIDLIGVLKLVDRSRDSEGLIAIEYCFTISWRTLQSLPPSVEYLNQLNENPEKMDDLCTMHNLILAPRTNHKVLGPWIKDALVKQGLTTAKAEALIKSISTTVNSLNYDVNLFKSFFEKLKGKKGFIEAKRGQILKSKDMPSFFDLLLLDSVMAKAQISLDKTFSGSTNSSKTEGESPTEHLPIVVSTAHDLVPLVLQAVESLSVCAKSLVLDSISGSKFDIMALQRCLSVSGVQCLKTVCLPRPIQDNYPKSLLSALEEWNGTSLDEYPPILCWRTQFNNTPSFPSESYITSIISVNVSGIRQNNIIHCLKHCLYIAALFTGELLPLCNDFSLLQYDLVRVLFPLILDATTNNLSELIALNLKILVGAMDSVQFLVKVYNHVLTNTYPILLPDTENIDTDTKEEQEEGTERYVLNEKILEDIVQYMEIMLETHMGRGTLDKFFRENDLIKILLSISTRGPRFASKVLKFFNQLYQLNEKNSSEGSVQRLCSTLSKLAEIPNKHLEEWLNYLVTGMYCQLESAKSSDEYLCLQENRALLQSLTNYIVKEENSVSEDVAFTILKCLIPMGSLLLSPVSEGLEFTELLVIMSTLAGAGSGKGHQNLLLACSEWLVTCHSYLSQKNVLEKMSDGVMNGKHGIMLENSCQIMSYMCDVIMALKLTINNDSSARASSPFDGENVVDTDNDYWIDEINDEDSAGEDSDDDSLCNKLCTYSQTQKEFVFQHWYNCHTCRMVDGSGVCTICAKVCHADHDVTYSKHGSFFCDCGAKEDGSCRAMTKRSPREANNEPSRKYDENLSNLSIMRHQSSSPPLSSHQNVTSQQAVSSSQPSVSTNSGVESKREDDTRVNLSVKLSQWKDELSSQIEKNNILKKLLEMLECLLPVIEFNRVKHSYIVRLADINKAFQVLHTEEKKYDHNDQLMLPTLGSQEGAFENVQMNYSGDQGQTIRHLMTGHMIRRVVMCCISTGVSGKKQHLAVSHEKGKITILQLSALLKQADSSQKKLTLTRLASTPVPFSVLSIVSNPRNEDFLAVSGLKDCHVLTFNPSGTVSDHLVLHPQLEASNYIIKAIWVPGSQTELALVTSDFVKIYDLSVDVLSPQHYFLVPSGKVRDCTLSFMEDGTRYVLIMSSGGHIYVQSLTEESSALNGPFYVTNIMDVDHPEIKHSSSERIGDGGVSIYYCHTLQCLFFSYVQGKSFMAPLKSIVEELSIVFPINIKSNSNNNNNNNGGNASGNNKSSGSNQQPLCQWGEIMGHPGLITAFLQTSNNPVILLVKPESIHVQELKVGSKSKIIDMVAIRHSVLSMPYSGASMNQKTTLILLCEDGSLKIYMANPETTDYWLNPVMNPMPCLNQIKPPRKLKKNQQNKRNGAAVGTSSQGSSLAFPIDFFESCSTISEVEFNGNDVLQVYNVNQIKYRLTTSGLYIANMMPTGFSMEVTNNDSNQVMVGIRVMLGAQDISRVPSYIEIFGRCIPVSLTLNRWFDLPFTREESLLADKKMTIVFGPSLDTSGVSIIDSIQVYGKTKEAFGWPEDVEESSSTNQEPSDLMDAQPLPLTPLDKLIASILELLEGCFALGGGDLNENFKNEASGLSTQMVTLPTQQKINYFAKTLLSSLFQNKTDYHNHKDFAVMKHVTKHIFESGKEQKESDEATSIDIESYIRLVLTTRSIAIARPLNLVKFAETRKENDQKLEEKITFINYLSNTFWSLIESKTANSVVGKIGQSGITHVESLVHALVDIFHAFINSDVDMISSITKLYTDFLLSKNIQVSFACKQALVRILRPRVRRRRVYAPSPDRCPSPGEEGSNNNNNAPIAEEIRQFDPGFPPPVLSNSGGNNNRNGRSNERIHSRQNENLNLGPGGIPLGGVAGNMDAMLPLVNNNNDGNNGNIPPVLDLPPEVDDEAMVELAIALSLQEQGGELNDVPQVIQVIPNYGLNEFSGLQGLIRDTIAAVASIHDPNSESGEQVAPLRESNPTPNNPMSGNSQQREAGHYSDTTPSAPGSDDESTAAMDGSTLRTPPIEIDPDNGPGSGAGSESGASAVESIIGDPSGRSSAYEGEGINAKTELANNIEVEWESNNAKLHSLRVTLLDHLLGYLPNLRDIGGVRCIPYMQVLIVLIADLDGSNETDAKMLEKMLSSMIKELEVEGKQDSCTISDRSNKKELQLVILRLFGVLMSRSKTWQSSQPDGLNYVSSTTASTLLSSGIVNYCLKLLKSLLTYWKESTVDENTNKVGSSLLKVQPSFFPPDMSPFFLKQYVKGHAHDVFESYPQLLTEMALRIPYHATKIFENGGSSNAKENWEEWHYSLCEYMMLHQTLYARRQVRRLLLYICGTKDRYRELRDLHTLESHMTSVREIIRLEITTNSKSLDSVPHLSFPYDTLLKLIEHLRACVDIATSHTNNWQKFCLSKDPNALAFLFQISFSLDEGVNPIVLQLLQSALCGANQKVKYFSSSSKKKYKGDHDGDGECNSVSIVSTLVKQINSPSQLLKFIETFLLECNSTSVRWQAHSILVTIHRNSDQSGKEDILNIMWKLWSKLPYFGRKASQFVDLLGYFSMKTLTKEDKLQDHVYVSKAIAILKSQNEILSNHPNANIYSSLSQLVDFNGYYLESDPCLVCNNPEVPNRALKLSALKIDTKYTTSSQIVKLSCSHSIGKINLRIGDLKRQKMVRVINIYYNNKSVQAVVELKNRSTIWHKAKKVTLSPGQTDIKVEFPLPIIACNLRIEYTDFYENIQASAETLQCPRCSTSVPANPGVCTNCGENVFQCHKCRSINYDEKDPFLCNACGFCKYAKFEYTLNTRPCCAVDPIENEDDYKKAVTSINSLLEKADKVYRNLISNKPSLENLLAKITESVNDKHPGDGAIDSFSTTASTSVANAANTGNIGTTSSNAVSSSTGSSSSNHVNQYIQTLASKYCSECKGSFEDLSKIIQKVMATRKELVSFENARKAKYVPGGTSKSPSTVGRSVSSGKCYGCAAATVEHCLTLLRALASKVRYRNELYQQGLIKQLMEYNLRRGTSNIRLEVRKLICLITRDNLIATNHLNKLIFSKIGLAVKGRISCPEIVESVRHEMSLLAATVSKEDSCWEVRLRCVLRIFILAIKQGGKTSPTVMECITLPCLKIIQGLVRPKGTFKSKSSVMDSSSYIQVDDWLKNKPGYHFEDWENKLSIVDEKATKDDSKNVTSSRDAKNTYLIEKYFKKWVSIVRENKNHPKKLESTLLNASWLKSVLFNSSSQMARQVGCNMVEGFCSGKRRLNIIDLLTSFLEELGTAGESASEYVQLYQKLIADEQVKYYLAVKGVLKKLADLISKEIDNLDHMEQTTLNSDLAQGFALKTLTEIISSFVSVDQIKNKFKGRLISTVLQGYLSLRRLVVQRTKLVDQTQDKLLELLEIMTTGTKAESEAFMAVCVETIKRYPVHDQLTPVFIFERLCNLIYPEETEMGEFFMTLDKDPQQEDFLQGRMLGNPYSSNDPDLGPLMRNVKNKICADCELVALLEDDNGMELLVHNKIVSLDLLVKDVYQKIWAPEANEGDPMKVIYRMRGLLGDATEEFIETLDNKEGEDKDEEEVYKMAGIMAECGGLEVMLERLASIHDVQYSKPLLLVLLKLFSHSIRLKVNREKLLNPTYKTIPLLLNCLKLSLSDSNSSINEMILEAMERLLVEAAAGNSISNYCQFASNCVSTEDIQALLKHAVNLRSGTALHSRLMRVLPFLTYGNDDKMELLLSHFSEVLEFDKFDIEHGADEDSKMETFVAICDGIERNKIGNTMKDLMVKSGIMNQCIEYIKVNAPASKTVLLKADDPFWKAFVTKPSLKYILRAMAGLAAKHPTTQLAVSSECISILHQMEQVSSDEHVGSLAESVLEAIKSHPDAFTKVVEVRQRTKAEKKKLAMAMRAKQLKAIGLKANDRGQVKAENSILQQFVEIAEESGLSCNICREGYKFQPYKVLAIYTYTKDCHLEEFESASRKQMGYSTVTHFNLVHVDCHLAAVRQARSRDEWDSALLQNANTKCNGLLPLWGPQVVESAYASSLARHNNYLAEATQHRDIGYHSTVHDLKLLLLRFAEDKSFSNESGGGGPQSNMHLVPYLMHMALYVLNTTRAASREEMNLNSFLDQPKNQWVDTGYIPDGPIYYTVIALLVFSPSSWKSVRIKLLQRLLLTAHTRSADPNHTGGNSLVDKEVKEYNVYKKMVLFFALIDQLYSVVFCNVPTDKDSWPVALSEWIRHNDDTLTKSTLKLLNVFQEDLVPASSVVEIADVCRLLEDIPKPASFLSDVLNSIP